MEKKENKKEKTNPIWGCLFVIFVPLSIVITCFFQVVLVRQFTSWFIMPLSGEIGSYILNIHWANLLGLLALKQVVFKIPVNLKDSENKTVGKLYQELFAKTFVLPLITLLVGYILHLFM